MNIDRTKVIKMVAILTLICVAVYGLTGVIKKNSLTLQEYAEQNPELAYRESEVTHLNEDNKEDSSMNNTAESNTSETSLPETDTSEAYVTENLQDRDNKSTIGTISTLPGAALNGETVLDKRITYQDSFYYEPLSENLQRYITGVSFPEVNKMPENADELAINYEDLRYLHILHYDFDGNLAEGELICNAAIAQDLVEIFYQLYYNEYQLEKVRLIDEYDGDDNASMEDNNTSCFNYRVVEGSTSLSKHAFGLAIDINPLYNPYITYNEDGSEAVAPASASAYADRNASFPYKIDENDLCYKLFKEHGFTWGGDWNSCKDYQHFQKVVK